MQLVCSLVSIYFDSPWNSEYNKNKLYKTLDYWSRDVLEKASIIHELQSRLAKPSNAL